MYLSKKLRHWPQQYVQRANNCKSLFWSDFGLAHSHLPSRSFYVAESEARILMSKWVRSHGIGSVRKKSWLRASPESIRSLGSRVSNLSIRSSAYWSFTYTLQRSFTRRLWPFGSSSFLYSSYFSTSGQLSVVMEPHSSQIKVSCCCSVSPCVKCNYASREEI